ncbi:ABC transporter permease [Bacillus sp. FJAT-52991]|uniref:ABC transporter permease n=1 Tax=Bacillus kandeliae TaxID=3129297 RepID=A0ABZ2N4W2_9BACI
MKSVTIAWKDVVTYLTDRKALVMMILMPILLTAILGAALKGVMGENATIPETTVGIYQEDTDVLGTNFVDMLVKMKDLNVEKVSSKQALQKKMDDESIDVGVIIPAAWSSNIQEGKLKSVTLLADPSKDTQLSLVQAITESFTDRVTTVSYSTNKVMTELAMNSTTTPINAETASSIAKELANEAEETSFVKQEPIEGKSVSSMQYYSAAMAVMFLLFNAMLGAKSIMNERRTETLARLMSTPTTKTTIFIGKFLGTFLYAIIQFSLFMVATRVFFKVNWGDNLLQTLTLSIAYAIAVSGLSMLLASFVTDEKMADSVGSIGVQILSLLGGSMVPIMVFPEVLQKMALVAPNTWALTSFIDIMAGTSWEALLLPIAVLLSFGIASIIIGTWRLRAQ